jgi:hypothetical protein
MPYPISQASTVQPERRSQKKIMLIARASDWAACAGIGSKVAQLLRVSCDLVGIHSGTFAHEVNRTVGTKRKASEFRLTVLHIHRGWAGIIYHGKPKAAEFEKLYAKFWPALDAAAETASRSPTRE